MFVNQTGFLLLFLLGFFKIPPSLAAQTSNRTISKKPTKNGTNKTDVRNNRIVGGYRCPIKQYPFLVSLRYLKSPKHFCAGSLLSEFWILTALHCLQERCKWTIEVIAGSSYAENPRKNPDNEALQFSTIQQCYFYPIVHKLKFDIALARLKNAIRQTNNVAYVLLPFDLPDANKSLVNICSNATIAGWGTQYATDMYDEPISYPVAEYDPHLQCIHLPVISGKECNDRSPTAIASTSFCTYKEKSSSCYGDSGGPLLCDGYLYGIVSYGFACAFEQFPAVHTNVLSFKHFILTTMESSFYEERSLGRAVRVTAKLSVASVILTLGLYKFIEIN